MNYASLKGFTLIEVLISLLLLSGLLLGLDALALHALQEAKSARFLYIAINQANNMIERLRALQSYNGLGDATLAWNAENHAYLPNGHGEVQGVYPNYSVTIYWGNFNMPCSEIKIGLNGCLKQTVTV